jgi:hypothetical protein
MCVRILSEFASTRDRQRFKSARARVDNMFRPSALHRASRDVRTRRTREMQCGVSGAGFSGLIRVSEKASGVAIFVFAFRRQTDSSRGYMGKSAARGEIKIPAWAR